jgi:hypothetical protein
MGIKTLRIIGMAVMVFLLIAAGTMACKSTEEDASDEGVVNIKEGQLDFEGTIKIVCGKYVFVPQVRGFDIVIQGDLDSGSISDLIGKEVKGVGEFTPERPSILVANTLEVRDENNEWTSVFQRNEDVVLDDFISIVDRDGFDFLEKLNYSKKEDWEGKEKAKIHGKLVGEEGSYKITVLDEKGKLVGKIKVDSLTDYAQYYIKKLKLFDEFWFYLNIKDTVEWRTRRRTRELFNADVVFAGLF